MKESDSLVTVHILDKPYKIKCPSHESHDLKLAASYLDEEMRKLRRAASLTHIESLAVVAALNMAHQVLQLKNQKNQQSTDVALKVQRLQQRIEESLATETEILV